MVARKAHNLEVVCSIHTSATKKITTIKPLHDEEVLLNCFLDLVILFDKYPFSISDCIVCKTFAVWGVEDVRYLVISSRFYSVFHHDQFAIYLCYICEAFAVWGVSKAAYILILSRFHSIFHSIFHNKTSPTIVTCRISKTFSVWGVGRITSAIIF